MLSTESRIEVADLLHAAEKGFAPLEPLATLYPGIDMVDAYEIQLLNIRRRVEAGERVVGHKVGLTAKAMQEMLGVSEPDYGHLFDTTELHEGEPVQCARFLLPRVEIEVAFVLGADLPGADCTVDDVLAATEFVVPSIELIDTRIKEWRIGLVDTVSDNASYAGHALGAARVRPEDIDLTAIDAALVINGERAAEGRSDAVLGHPARAVAWLARTVDTFGVRLRAGDVVLPGSCTKAVDVRPGDHVRAEFSGLGTVSVEFV
ncbi:2-keto-4-pentenoate hydratase [Rhodococcus spelaei]|uniref:2-keto-4-pentenoate hydratase n=1 Tax=Rhodococcus spelaei TaxID=2546320 RepID=A0A541BRZ9_9NOCA|nr:2-keto-4-pentenoate hydratase [Rhodococcus spelaei]TQF75110.1 2-keto-4-pentenoate hydratase [Rhodococcus spelaei]